MIRIRFSLISGVRALAVGVWVAAPVAALAQQVQPPPMPVYSSDFGGGTSAAAPGAATGTTIAVDIAELEALEAGTLALEQRMQAHVTNAGAHVPHGHPAHSHGGGPTSVPTADARGGHEPLRELVAQIIEFLVPFAEAQVQPPPLVVYDRDMSGPSSTAPSTTRTDLGATLDVDIPLVDVVRALIARLGRELTVHIAARPGHAHGHPHSH